MPNRVTLAPHSQHRQTESIDQCSECQVHSVSHSVITSPRAPFRDQTDRRSAMYSAPPLAGGRVRNMQTDRQPGRRHVYCISNNTVSLKKTDRYD